MKRGFPLAIQKQAIQKLFRQTLAFQRGQTATRRGVSSAVMLIIFLGAAPLYANTSEEHLPTLLVMGDSLSAAYGIEQEQGWVTLLAERLDGEAQVVNASISGETTSGGAQRFAGIIGQQQPDIVLLELGGNDGLRGLPPAQMRTNLATMIEQSQQAGAEVLLLGIDIPPNYGQAYRDAFTSVFHSLADEYDIPLVPFLLEDIALNKQLMQSDGIHPTAEAQPIILENAWSELEPMLEETYQASSQ
jgi:acyl-CoA thioesterase-1